MDCAPENTREPRTGASARAFRVAVLNQSYASAESFTLRGKVLPEVVEKNCTEPCLVQDLQACSHSWTKLPTLVIPTPKLSTLVIPTPGLLSFRRRSSPPLSFRRRKAEESAALPRCCRIDFAMLSMKRQASPPARRARRPPLHLHASPCTR